MSVSNLKPYFQEDLLNLIKAVYFSILNSNRSQISNPDFRMGVASTLIALGLLIGISPSEFLLNDDIKYYTKDGR